MTSPGLAPDAAPHGLAERYEVRAVLGRGGMACVYRAFDRVRGCEVALKQLTIDTQSPERRGLSALFEREFQTLTQLRHPHVISVHDYGITQDAGPYYTMELLDGGDLLERVPVPWAEACALMFDVCSSLALLHSRRLLHRDISPRNIRRTQAGAAKLIDFGAMGPMTAGGAQVVGTPAFSAPETLHRLALDARTDLYSVGVTLYYALTGHLPYAGRSFADMLAAWTTKVIPPSVLSADVPAALDDLVLSLIHTEPALRPASAYEVMQRLAAIAGLPDDEVRAVSQAYLVTPSLVGRAAALEELRKRLTSARLMRGGGTLISGPSGIGRSRLLDACVLEARTLGFSVFRAAATGSAEPFSVAQALVQHLFASRPALRDNPHASALLQARTEGASDAAVALKPAAELARSPSQTQRTFCELLVAASREQPLLLAVDDIHRIDQPSAAVLAALLDTRRLQLFIALTSDADAPQTEPVAALARRCELLTPEPLSREETHELLGSLFGDISHLSMLTREIYQLTAGNPRQCMDMAQHLLDRGVVRYEAGTWILPPRLSTQDLPRDAASAMRARVARLSPHARWLAQAQALAYFETFGAQDYHALLPEVSSAQIEQAVSALLAMQVIVRDGQLYSLANRVWAAALSETLSPEERLQRHRALTTLYAAKSPIAQVHHAFSAGLDELGLELVEQRHRGYDRIDYQEMIEHNLGNVIWTYEPAIATAIRLGRTPRQIHDLRRWQLAGAIAQEWGRYSESARVWLAQIEHDCGLTLYRADTQSAPGERLTKALQGAHERYQATPETERVYSVESAIKLLAEYVVYAIALGGRAQDVPLLRELPELLEPFAVLSPVLDAIHNNARATCASVCDGDFERARAIWMDVVAKLDAVSGAELQHVDAIRNAVLYALALMDVQLGLGTVTELAARLDHDPYQSVAALTLRKIERLEQGDWRGAENYRRRAEVMALELRWPQMFKSSLLAEVSAYARAGDLAGLQQTIEQLRRLAQRYPGWQPNVVNAEGYFHLVRGDLEAAKRKFEECINLTALADDGQSAGISMWLSSHSGLAEVLFGLERFEQSRAIAERALALCDARGLGSPGFDAIRILALAEGRLGHGRAACARVEALIMRQQQLGSSGLRIGLSYETRARLALWSGDTEAFESYARLTAQAYRHGARSPLGARYERLLNEAKRLGMQAGESLPELQLSSVVSGEILATQDLLTVVSRSMAGKVRSEQRAEAALALLCTARSAASGHLYLLSPASAGEPSLKLCATRGQPSDESLAAAAQALVAAEQARSEAMAEMNTGELEEETAPVSFVESGGIIYELMPLSCVNHAESTLVGVAAVMGSEAQLDRLRQAQLLQALARHLLRDCTHIG